MLSEYMSPDSFLIIKFSAAFLNPAVYGCHINGCVKELHNNALNINGGQKYDIISYK